MADAGLDTNSKYNLPYFDEVIYHLNMGNPDFQKAFGRHVHWGYWDQPEKADGTPEDFAIAAQRMCEEIFDLADISSHQKILDVGCGFGGTIASLNEGWNDIDLVGLNIDERQLKVARVNVTPSETNAIDFVQGDACSLPFPSNSFDRILAVECIFHFPSRRRFFAEAHRVLKKGGKLIISDITPTSLLLLCKGLILPIVKPALEKNFGSIQNECSISSYIKLAHELNFSGANIREITRQTMPTHPFMRMLYKTHSPTIYRRQLVQDLVVQSLAATGLLKYVLMSWVAN